MQTLGACMCLMKVFFVVLFSGICIFAKEPVTEGETDPVMLDLDPYMIEALRSKKFEGRFGKEGSLAHLMKEPAFQKLIEKI